jgi:hypothetical protein
MCKEIEVQTTYLLPHRFTILMHNLQIDELPLNTKRKDLKSQWRLLKLNQPSPGLF